MISADTRTLPTFAPIRRLDPSLGRCTTLMQLKGLHLALVLCAASAVLRAQSVTISPGYTDLGVNQTLQYSATVTGLPSLAVTWEVSGVPGGNSGNGTITPSGLYTAPAVVPTNGVTIIALASDNKTMGIVYVNIAPVGPPITSVTPNPVPAGSYAATVTGTGFQQ